MPRKPDSRHVPPTARGHCRRDRCERHTAGYGHARAGRLSTPWVGYAGSVVRPPGRRRAGLILRRASANDATPTGPVQERGALRSHRCEADGCLAPVV